MAKIRSALLLALLLTAGAAAAGAQVTTALGRLEIALWPEYDDPGVLVMLRGWLPDDAPLPTYVPIPLPQGVEPTAVAKRDAAGNLLNAAHTLVDRGSLQEVRIATDTREIRLEYYAPIERAGTTRTFRFTWPALIELDSVLWEVQQPVGASGMTTSPPSEQTRTGFDGLTYIAGNLGSRGADETFTIDVSYTKTTSSLTVAAMRPTAATSPAPSAPPGGQAEQAPPNEGAPFSWMTLIPVALIAALLIIWFLHSGGGHRT